MMRLMRKLWWCLIGTAGLISCGNSTGTSLNIVHAGVDNRALSIVYEVHNKGSVPVYYVPEGLFSDSGVKDGAVDITVNDDGSADAPMPYADRTLSLITLNPGEKRQERYQEVFAEAEGALFSADGESITLADHLREYEGVERAVIRLPVSREKPGFQNITRAYMDYIRDSVVLTANGPLSNRVDALKAYNQSPPASGAPITTTPSK